MVDPHDVVTKVGYVGIIVCLNTDFYLDEIMNPFILAPSSVGQHICNHCDMICAKYKEDEQSKRGKWNTCGVSEAWERG